MNKDKTPEQIAQRYCDDEKCGIRNYRCDQCRRIVDIVTKERERIQELEAKIKQLCVYKANFLWPHEDDSLESLLYEFVNCKMEGYRKAIYDEIKAKLFKTETKVQQAVNVFKELKHLNHHTIDEEVWRIENILADLERNE